MKTFHTLACMVLSCGVLYSATKVDPEVIKKNAYNIDKLVAANFRSNDIAVPEVTDDATFLRRAFLVSVGRIPTAQEALDFLELQVPNKRTLLVDYLFSSEGYNSHTYNWLYDLLTLRERVGTGGNISYNGRLIDWVRESVQENKPWDQFTKELISTRGNAYVSPGAAGYYDKGDAIDDHLSNTLRIFTGVRMECAQCHDDPFQEWEQMDFYNFKAFVDGQPGYNVNNKIAGVGSKLRRVELEDPVKYKDATVGRMLFLHYAITNILELGLSEKKGVGMTKLPSDYQYSDGDPGEAIGGRSAFGAKLRSSGKREDVDALEDFANWMVSDKTPQYAQTISTRLWERVMGISLTPVTGDYVSPEKTNFRSLIIHLSKLIKDYDYDIKTFQKTLMLTKTFQFVSSKKNLKNGSKRALDGRRSKRMSAEQIWDSFISLVEEDPESLPKREQTELNFNFKGQFIMEIPELVEKMSGMNEGQYNKFLHEMFEKLRNGEYPPAKGEEFGNRRSGKILQRASEIPTPAPNDHFLTVFGQSQRGAAIDEASVEGTVSQALELLNGKVQEQIVHNPDAAVNKVLNKIEGTEERIRTVFLTVLNRIPDEEEFKFCIDLAEKADSEESFFRNLVAGLISSQEFYFIF